MADQDCLDLGGRDVLPTSDDQVLQASGDAEVAALVENAQIACVHEAVGVHRADRRVGIVQVLDELLVTPGADLTLLAYRNRFP